MFILEPKIDSPTEEERHEAINNLKESIQEAEPTKTREELETLTRKVITVCDTLSKQLYSEFHVAFQETWFLINLYGAAMSFDEVPNLPVNDRMEMIKGIIFSYEAGFQLMSKLEELTTEEKITNITQIINNNQQEQLAENVYFRKGIELWVADQERKTIWEQNTYFYRMVRQNKKIESANNQLLVTLMDQPKEKNKKSSKDLYKESTMIAALCVKLAPPSTTNGFPDIWEIGDDNHVDAIVRNIKDAIASFSEADDIPIKDRLNIIRGIIIGRNLEESYPQYFERLNNEEKAQKIMELIDKKNVKNQDDYSYLKQGVSLGIRLRHENKQNKKSY